MTTSADPALRLCDVGVAYGPRPVLAGVTGEVAPGGSLALIGPNGAGKSTLIKAVLGLVDVTAGRIEVLGTTPGRARGRVAYVPQAESLDPEFPITVAQVVLMGRYRRIGWVRRPGRADRTAAGLMLDRVGLAGRAGDRFGSLSGGQRQRVLIARALVQEPELLLLDEPFNGVDTTTTEVLLDVLAEQRKAGVAVVMATHDLSIAHLACDTGCLLNHHQVAFAPIDEALSPELLGETYGRGAVVLAGDSTIVNTR
ncbi:MAG TPA: metal ABC transporter ATP-binding protein [Acidimicrobiia bacterium]|nr:metal ABC transporter ATP-binding protein [Acidimicrobiia bacterium]